MDFIQRILRLSADERKEMLCDAIRRKCKYPVSKARLDYIIERLNLGRKYLIKVTSDPNKFLNIATSEHIDTGDRILLSQVFTLYGRFTPGCFVKTKIGASTPVLGTINADSDAAAVKMGLSYSSNGSILITYTLVLYEMKRN